MSRDVPADVVRAPLARRGHHDSRARFNRGGFVAYTGAGALAAWQGDNAPAERNQRAMKNKEGAALL